MKKLLFLLLVAFNSLAQKPSVTLPIGASITLTTGWYPSVTTSGQNNITIIGDVDVSNFTFKGTTTINILRGSNLINGSGIKLQKQDSLFIVGIMHTQDVQLQNGHNYLSIKDGALYVENNVHLNDESDIHIFENTTLYVSGSLNITGNSHAGAIKLFNCATVNTYSINVNKDDAVTGMGTFVISRGNINQRFTNSSYIYLKTDVQSKNWGAAQIGGTCTNNPLPVKVIKDYVNEKEWYIEFSDTNSLDYFDVEESTDGKVWIPKKSKIENNKASTKYSGNL